MEQRSSRRPEGTLAVEQPGLREALPFGVVVVIGLLSVLMPPVQLNFREYLFGMGLFLVTIVLFVLSLRQPKRTWLHWAAPYSLFPVVVIVRDAAGGTSAGAATVVLIPLLWLAITGPRRELYGATVLVAAVFILPVLLVGPPTYPHQEWRRSITWVAIAVIIGPVLQRIVELLARETHHAIAAGERSARLFEDAPNGVLVLAPDGTIARANTALAKMIGFPVDELVGRSALDLSAAGDTGIESVLSRLADPTEHAAREHLDSGESVSGEAVLRTSARADVHVSLSGRSLRHAGEQADEDLVLLNVVDVSERRRYQDRLAYLVDHDVLTGLASRRRFDDELTRHLDRCRRYGPAGAVLLLDLDNFKQVNDTLGHGAGDQLLISIGDVLRRSVRRSDVVARMGGDEFAILLADGDHAAAAGVAAVVVDRVASHAATLDGVHRRVSASVGVVTFRAAMDHAVDIMALADMTMYEAKEAGRNQYAVLPEGDTRLPRLGARLQWQSRMEEALETDRFVLLLQPLMNLHTGEIESAEALLRLRGEDGELIPPSRFLYIAERSELITRIDEWVVERGIALLAQVREVVPDFRLEVNLSGHSIGSSSLEGRITEALARHRVPADALVLEITETVAVADVGLARQFAQRMAALGCKFALDDFGAGFGSFYYLKHLVFDYVKIDGEFVASVHNSMVDRTIMRSIVGIARDLGKQTVAEFVSEPEILEVVKAEGVDYAQGYLIGKPESVDELIERLTV